MKRSRLRVMARHRYDASPERVFQAFSEPALLTRWFSPSTDITVEVLIHEFRLHGRYRLRYTQPGGTVDIVRGEFREIQHPTRLVFTWTWEPPDPHADVVTLVTVDFVADPGGTLVEVTHDRLPDETTRDRHDRGWHTTLMRLPQALA